MDCVIPYCEFDGASMDEHEDAKLVPICGLHKIHLGCLKALLKNEKCPKCPVCRDDYLSQLKELLSEAQPPPPIPEFLVPLGSFASISSLPPWYTAPTPAMPRAGPISYSNGIQRPKRHTNHPAVIR